MEGCMNDLPQQEGDISGTILIVDDSKLDRAIHRQVLSKKFDVLTAESGEEALEICQQKMPDLVLLDVFMPNLNGLEVCQRIREMSDVPVLFVTSCQTPEEHLKAYDAGGSDIVTKPINAELLLRKAVQAIRQSAERRQLESEKNSLQSMAMNFLSSVGENGILLNFMRAGTTCRNHSQLAEQILMAIGEFGVWSSVMIRHQGGVTVKTLSGAPTELESAVMEKLSTMGRIFEFKTRLAVNYDHVTIVASGLPSDPEKSGRIRDNITILAESAEALCDVVNVRKESSDRAEQIQMALSKTIEKIKSSQSNHSQLLMDIRLCLQDFELNIEKSYAFMGTTPDQERAIGITINKSIDQIVDMLSKSSQVDQVNFEELLSLIRGNDNDDDLLFF
jgi:CheY-like chemotaxis protein